MDIKSQLSLREQPIAVFPNLMGWTATLEAKLDAVLSTYICTNYQQSTHFLRRLVSLPYTLGRFVQDPEGFATTVQSELGRLLNLYFKTADVRTAVEPIPGKEHFVNIRLFISVSDLDGTSYKQNSIVFTEDAKISRIVHYTNTGEVKYERNLSKSTFYR